MNLESMRKLYDYDRWANQKVWDCVEKLSEAQFKQKHDYSAGSVYNQVYHLMTSELWALKIFGVDTDAEFKTLKQDDFPTRAAIHAQWDGYVRRVQDHLNALTDPKIQAEIAMPLGSGLVLKAPMWEFLMSMIDHSADHRAQILARIHQLGGETCEQGYFFYLIERQH